MNATSSKTVGKPRDDRGAERRGPVYSKRLRYCSSQSVGIASSTACVYISVDVLAWFLQVVIISVIDVVDAL